MFQPGRICVRLAGRDANKKCVIVDVLDNRTVLIDGNVRRRKSNILHLKPLNETIEINKGASHEEVVEEFKKKGLLFFEKKSKPKTQRPKKVRRVKERTEKK